ncbi:hypothetical protein ABZ723_34470 [Streptomyces sp. NPDC006700]|uniref:hypothetical protein n=1 Tax=Streptomyces sp. NPDC006700 TaxID=3154479 RepID=UPI0033FB058D
MSVPSNQPPDDEPVVHGPVGTARVVPFDLTLTVPKRWSVLCSWRLGADDDQDGPPATA